MITIPMELYWRLSKRQQKKLQQFPLNCSITDEALEHVHISAPTIWILCLHKPASTRYAYFTMGNSIKCEINDTLWV